MSLAAIMNVPGDPRGVCVDSLEIARALTERFNDGANIDRLATVRDPQRRSVWLVAVAAAIDGQTTTGLFAADGDGSSGKPNFWAVDSGAARLSSWPNVKFAELPPAAETAKRCVAVPG